MESKKNQTTAAYLSKEFATKAKRLKIELAAKATMTRLIRMVRLSAFMGMGTSSAQKLCPQQIPFPRPPIVERHT